MGRRLFIFAAIGALITGIVKKLAEKKKEKETNRDFSTKQKN